MGLPQYSENMPEHPIIFIKPSTSVIGTGQNIKYPSIGEHVDIEAELALVISKVSKNIDKNKWMEHVLGITIANDLSERCSSRGRQVILQELKVLILSVHSDHIYKLNLWIHLSFKLNRT